MSPPPSASSPRALVGRLAELLRHEFAAGVMVASGAIAAVVWSLIDETSYLRVVNTHWNAPLLERANLDSLHAVTVNGLMTVFFFVVGLELSREWRTGLLRHRRTAALPVLAAIGGMAGSALLLALIGELLHSPMIVKGWGVPTATDIAFTLAALSLAGRGVPRSLRIFVLTLAIADDLLAVVILAVAYQHHTAPVWLLVGALVLVPLLVIRRRMPAWIYVVALVVVWLCFIAAHVEPALAGVAVGLCVPFGSHDAGSRLEHSSLPLSNGLVLPLFALCACGVAWSQLSWNTSVRQAIGALIIARLLGKSFGITSVVVIAGRWGLSKPSGVSTSMMAATSLLCAIGFTVPLLFAEAVYGFDDVAYATTTVGLLTASVIAAVVGVSSLRFIISRRTQ